MYEEDVAFYYEVSFILESLYSTPDFNQVCQSFVSVFPSDVICIYHRIFCICPYIKPLFCEKFLTSIVS
jgi:hypothetical protein